MQNHKAQYIRDHIMMEVRFAFSHRKYGPETMQPHNTFMVQCSQYWFGRVCIYTYYKAQKCLQYDLKMQNFLLIDCMADTFSIILKDTSLSLMSPSAQQVLILAYCSTYIAHLPLCPIFLCKMSIFVSALWLSCELSYFL